MSFYLRSERKLKMDLASWFVCLMGIGVVFLGLICLILLCKVIGLFVGNKKPAKESAPAPAQPIANTTAAPIENRGEIIAAVSAAIAEELGEDISSIRILSFKKIGG